MRKNGIVYSVILHSVMFAVIIFGLPTFFRPELAEHNVVTVEILPVSEFTNIKTARKKPKPPEEKPKENVDTKSKLSMPDPTMKPEKPVMTPEAIPEPKARKPEEKVKEKEIEPLAKPKPQETVKKEEKKPDPKKKDEPQPSFGDIVNDLSKLKEENKEEKLDFEDVENFLSDVDTSDSKEADYKEGLPLTISEKDAIVSQITRNWNVSSFSGSKEAKEMVVVLTIDVNIDGTIKSVDYKDKARYNADAIYRAMVDSVIRAAWITAKLQGLPPEKYYGKNGWEQVESTFSAKDMLSSF